MIDFNNKVLFKLSPANNGTFQSKIEPLLVEGEEVLLSFSAARDGVVFTNYRIIAINVQGLTGKKVDLTSLPYKKIQTFSVETAGTFDLDAEMDLWFSGLGRVRFEFTGSTNVKALAKIIGTYCVE